MPNFVLVLFIHRPLPFTTTGAKSSLSLTSFACCCEVFGTVRFAAVQYHNIRIPVVITDDKTRICRIRRTLTALRHRQKVPLASGLSKQGQCRPWVHAPRVTESRQEARVVCGSSLLLICAFLLFFCNCVCVCVCVRVLFYKYPMALLFVHSFCLFVCLFVNCSFILGKRTEVPSTRELLNVPYT